MAGLKTYDKNNIHTIERLKKEFIRAVDLIEILDPEREYAKDLNRFDLLIDELLKDQVREDK